MDELEKLKRELITAEKASATIITNMKNLLLDALEHNQWNRIAELESYISGCKQIKIVYEMAVKKSEKQL